MIWFLVFTSLGIALSTRLLVVGLAARPSFRDLLVTGGTLLVCAWLAPWLDGFEVRLARR